MQYNIIYSIYIYTLGLEQQHTTDRSFASHVANLGSVSGTPYGPYSSLSTELGLNPNHSQV